jgi:DNA-binding response OmpR family regulator
MFSILLIEDNTDIMTLNERSIKRFCPYKIEIYKATNIEEARGILFSNGSELDLVVLDLFLPDGDGLTLIQTIRNETSASIIILSAKGQKEDIVKGLQTGSDDYITKPYDIDEFCARVTAALRRKDHLDILENGRIKLDIASNRAYLDGDDLLLTPKQFSLLLIFIKNAGKVLSPEFLYESIWKQPIQGEIGALWRQISNLKAKIEKAEIIHISTVRGKGYVFEIAQSFYEK